MQTAPTEKWTAVAAIAAAATVLFKKLFSRQPTPKHDYITRAEFHQGLDLMRDHIASDYRILTDKIENLGATLHEKLTQLESAVARLDERTRK